MKSVPKSNGQAIQARTASWRPGQITTRFRRQRIQHTEVPNAVAEAYLSWDDGWDDYWSYYRDDYYPQLTALSLTGITLEAAFHRRANQYLAMAWPGGQLTPEGVRLLPSAQEDPDEPSPKDELTAELKDYLEALRKETTEFSASLLEQLSDEEMIMFSQLSLRARGRQDHDLIMHVLLFAPFWVRNPLTWHALGTLQNAPPGTSVPWMSLVDHLFAIYTYPPCLVQAWKNLDSYNVETLNWLVLFMISAQGGSIERAVKHFDWKISRTVWRHFVASPSHLHPFEAFRHAWVVSCGGSQLEADHLWFHPHISWPNPFEKSDQADNAQHWNNLEHERAFTSDTIQWLSLHRDAIDADACALLLPWAIHLRTEAEAGRGVFSWKGRSVSRSLEQAAEYRASFYRQGEQFTWKSQGWNWDYVDPEGANKWSIRELTSTPELYEEGLAMSHCVGAYGNYCRSGHCAIFSLRRNGERSLTIEMAPKSRHCSQARGKANREPTSLESSVLLRWRQEKLSNFPASEDPTSAVSI